MTGLPYFSFIEVLLGTLRVWLFQTIFAGEVRTNRLVAKA